MGAAQQISFTFSHQFEKMPLFNAAEVNFSRYSQFVNGQEFDNHWEQFMLDNKIKYTKLQLDALRIVRQFAYKNGGVCNASYRTMMQAALALYGYEISRDTFRDAIDKTEDLGGLRKHAGQRLIKGRGSRTANVIIFNRIEDVRTYQIAKEKRQKEEIEALLEEEYKKASAMNNYAYNAKKWAEQKAENQRNKAEELARQERERKEVEAAAKRQTLFSKVLAALKSQKLDTTNISEYMSILYAAIKKTMAADQRLTKNQAEQIALEQFYRMAMTPDADIKKNRYAYLSHLLRSNLLAITEGYTSTELAQKRAASKGKRIEKVPDWFNNRNENKNEHINKTIDFEEEKKKIFEKINK